ncbi:MAG: PEP-CTERM sorting domain-containing protein [Fimbriimonadaceae bacterium]|nr:PEP-CTERM sorting domain-containing protein [Fimbriimonadaceae bacterium]
MKRYAFALLMGVASVGVHAQTVFNDFEAATVGTSDMFRLPNFSGSTGTQLEAAPNVSQVLAGGIGTNTSNVLQNQFQWTATGNWLRLTTFGANRLPNPALNLNQFLLFDVYTTLPVRFAVGVRETGGSGPIGANGGTTGTIEWVGTSTTMNSATPAGMPVPTGVWTTVSVQLKGSPSLGFTGDGTVTGDWGVLEHIAIQRAGGSVGPHDIYLDNFRQDVVPEPTSMAALGLGALGVFFRRRNKKA